MKNSSVWEQGYGQVSISASNKAFKPSIVNPHSDAKPRNATLLLSIGKLTVQYYMGQLSFRNVRRIE